MPFLLEQISIFLKPCFSCYINLLAPEFYI